MAKSYKNLFCKVVDFQNLFLAAKKAQKGKRFRPDVLIFNFNLESELWKLQEELASKAYQPGQYKDFWVYDSKPRLISAAPYRDRVVHHAVMNVIEPIFERSFIYDTYACRKGKGMHAALRRFRYFLDRYKYVLKCDIQKYFQSMDHQILLESLTRRIADRDLMWLLKKIVCSRDYTPEAPIIHYQGDDLFTPLERSKGIPVGNHTSQFFANLYLNKFDHWLKDKLGVKGYLRYVDDFCVFADDKSFLNDLKQAIVEKLCEFRLAIHPEKSRVYTRKEGVEFLGFRHHESFIRLRAENMRRFKRRMRQYQKDFSERKIEPEKIRMSLQSWSAHASYGSTRALRRVLIPSIVFTVALNKRERV